jgi:hypothetical protein
VFGELSESSKGPNGHDASATVLLPAVPRLAELTKQYSDEMRFLPLAGLCSSIVDGSLKYFQIIQDSFEQSHVGFMLHAIEWSGNEDIFGLL